jgi:nicotinamidase-related amidase
MATGDSQKRFNPMPDVHPSPGDTALIIIDMQYRSVHPDYGWAKRAREEGNFRIFDHLFARLPAVIANIQHMQRACRESGIEVIYSVIRSWTRDGRDLSPSYRLKGARCAPGTKDVEILEELKPVGDEIVLNKLSTNAFASSPMDAVLRYMNIRELMVAGVNTNYCVESFVRTASDLGYEVVLLEDCCATLDPRHHDTTCEEIDGIFCKVYRSSEMLAEIREGARIRRPA